jgi:hypothetical protein
MELVEESRQDSAARLPGARLSTSTAGGLTDGTALLAHLVDDVVDLNFCRRPRLIGGLRVGHRRCEVPRSQHGSKQ